MVDIIAQALFGAALLFFVVLAWVGVQALFRKSENLPPDCDVLGDTGRGCAQCGRRESCADPRNLRQ